MADNKEFDSIMREITSGLTGESDKDMKYLKEQMDKYKGHEMGREIIRACDRLLYELIPDDTKEKLEYAIDNDRAGLKAALEEAHFNIYKKDFNKAMRIMEALVRKVEALHAFEDDEVSEYHVFDELFEEALYRYREKPEKDIRQAQIPYTEIYMLYGSLLVEMGRLPEAREALEKGLRWNPVCFRIMAEYIETFKMSGDMESFFEKTREALRIAFRPADVARCFRNLGYYYAEVKQWQEAKACLLLSLRFEGDNSNAQSELYYIHSVTEGKVPDPIAEELEEYGKEYGFPTGADGEIVALAFSYGMDAFKHNNIEAAIYFLTITYSLTHDEHIKEILDRLTAFS